MSTTDGAKPGKARRGRTLRWLLLWTSLFLLLLAILASLGAADDLREFADFRKQVSLSRLAGCRCLPRTDLELNRPDGVTLAASYYGSNPEGGEPWVVLVHGNTPRGRRLGVYRVLSRGLARRGFSVLTLDQSGYGESGDPFRPGTVEALDRRLDVLAALDYIDTVAPERDSGIFLVGHSAGAPPVLRAGIDDGRVAGMVAIGPPRRVRERLADVEDREYFWMRARRTRRLNANAEFPAWFTAEQWLELSLRDAMEQHAEYFSTDGHKPLLLIDGERESEDDRSYLRRFAASIDEPKEYATIAESNHYCSAKEFAGGRWIFFDREVVGETLDRIERWIRGQL